MRTFTIVLLFVGALPLFAQEKFTISGFVRDSLSGETLVAANLVLKDNSGIGVNTNTYGFYSLSVAPGIYELEFSYLGYQSRVVRLELFADLRLNVSLLEGIDLAEVVVAAEAEDQALRDPQMGVVALPIEQVKKLPALMGEVDILKALQLLPGVMSAGEGNSGFYVRGGGPDQNLILLDEAPVYNSGHLLGFFSVFNSDAIKNTRLIKGGMPASYGGRLSSVIDITMKEGNDKSYAMKGGIGWIASRLTLEGPLIEDKSSFLISARRTYLLDLAQPFIKQTNFAGTNYYFYDLNAKINVRFSDKDRLFFSTYFGRDILAFESNQRGLSFRLPYGNATATLRWNHLFGAKSFLNTAVIYNDYDFGFEGGQGEWSFNLFSGVRDWNFKSDLDIFPNAAHQLKFGVNAIYHRLTPNVTRATNGETSFSSGTDPRYAGEFAVYAQDEWEISPRVGLEAGLRWVYFAQLRSDIVADYMGLEPRINLRWSLDDRSSVKAAATWSNQFIHLVSNSSSTLPGDIWVPSSKRVRPQQGVQYAMGYFRNFDGNMWETSLEVYYKYMRNQIDYRETYVNDIGADLDEEFVFGTGLSYGAEWLIQKNKGALTGWLGYTLSRTDRSFAEINNGERFPARYDRRHDLSLVLNYQLNPKWDLGLTFIFGSGQAFTPVERLYFIDQLLVQEYGERNSARLKDYHRMDMAATYTPKPAMGREKKFHSSWTFSVYNLYNRQNPFFIYYSLENNAETSGFAKATAFQVSLFPIIPSLTWNFTWNDIASRGK
jgi:hypothetical protein